MEGYGLHADSLKNSSSKILKRAGMIYVGIVGGQRHIIIHSTIGLNDTAGTKTMTIQIVTGIRGTALTSPQFTSELCQKPMI
jgi:hypothetical protein